MIFLRPNPALRSSNQTATALVVVATAIIVTAACGEYETVPAEPRDSRLSGAYMGQTPPGLTPVKFLGDVLDHSFCSVFSSDGREYYFTHYDPESGDCSIEVMRRDGDEWGTPEIASFSSDFIDNDIAISSNGRRVVFRSNRPLPDDDPQVKRDALYLWTSVREQKGWGPAEPVVFDGRGDIPGGYPALTDDGFVYFTANQPGETGPKDIYRSKLGDGGFGSLEPLTGGANSPHGEGDLFVSPDGGTLIVSRYDHPENIGGASLDLWVSFRLPNGTWGEAVNLGPPINTTFGENCPAVSPDGRYLFFNRYTGEEDHPDNGTYWVDAAILDRYQSTVK